MVYLLIRIDKLVADNNQLEAANKIILSQKKSSETRTGQIAEQLAPFLVDFPYNPKQAHFLGMPIDYIVFADDKVVFLEVKSGNAQLSSRQRQIKALVEQGKVEWAEFRIKGVSQNAEVQEAPEVPSVTAANS